VVGAEGNAHRGDQAAHLLEGRPVCVVAQAQLATPVVRSCGPQRSVGQNRGGVLPAERDLRHAREARHLLERGPGAGVAEAQLTVGVATRGPQGPVAQERGRVLPPKRHGLHARQAHLGERPPVGRVIQAELPVGIGPREPQRPVAEQRGRVLAVQGIGRGCARATEHDGLHVGQGNLGERGPVSGVAQSQLPVGV